jgi:Flp pilus assembly protein TadB
MTPRDELIMNQMKADARLYRGMFFFCLIGVAFGVAITVHLLLVENELLLSCKAACIAIGILGMALGMKGRGDSAARALEEIGAEAQDLGERQDYSESTMGALREAQHTRGEYVQLVVAYSILGVMLLAVGVLLIALTPSLDMPYLFLVGDGLFATGLLFMLTAFKDYRSLVLLGKIEALERDCE